MDAQNNKLWNEVYQMLRKGDFIDLTKENIERIYNHVHEKTGMCTDDINVFMISVVEIVASDLIAEKVLSTDFEWESDSE